MKVIHAMIEHSIADCDIGVLALYFDAKPTTTQVKSACKLHDDLGLSVDLEDEFWDWTVAQTPVSKAAKVIRVEVTPIG